MLRPGHTIAAVPATFHDSEYSRENLARLRDEMHAALIEDGLYADEATALLNTWELGYFKSPGMRVFFLYRSNGRMRSCRWVSRLRPRSAAQWLGGLSW